MLALDTLSTADPDTRIILYSNNTWRYYRPSLPAKYADLPVYTQHWDTEQVFAYKGVEIADLPATIELKLFDKIEDVHCPLQGRVISPYGPRGRRNHNGVDIPLKIGEPIYAAFDGKVRYAKYNTGGFGNLVILRHPNGLETWYAHQSKLHCQPNDYVKAGQIIGFGGSTGRSYGPHLHFEVRYSDLNFDPQFLFDFETGSPRYQTFVLERSFLNIHSRATDELDEDDSTYQFDPTISPLLTQTNNDGTTILERVEKAEAAQQAQQAEAAKPQPAGINPSNAVYYTVRSGDTLGSIAAKNHTTVGNICKLNGITTKTPLKVGKRLRVK